MCQITSAASDRIYDDSALADFLRKGDFTKLRSLINLRSDIFNRAIQISGKTYKVQSVAGFKNPTDTLVSKSIVPVFQPPYFKTKTDEGPHSITVESYCEHL